MEFISQSSVSLWSLYHIALRVYGVYITESSVFMEFISQSPVCLWSLYHRDLRVYGVYIT